MYRNYIHPHKQYSEKVTLESREDEDSGGEVSKSITRQVLA